MMSQFVFASLSSPIFNPYRTKWALACVCFILFYFCF